jgi:hypothetical protein
MSGSSINPEVLDLLTQAMRQMETDAVEIDQASGWFQPLGKLIETNRMPTAWENIVAYLRRHGHETGIRPPALDDHAGPRELYRAGKKAAARNHR